MAIIVECDNCKGQARYSGKSGGIDPRAAGYVPPTTHLNGYISAASDYLCGSCRKAKDEAMEAAGIEALAKRRPASAEEMMT